MATVNRFEIGGIFYDAEDTTARTGVDRVTAEVSQLSTEVDRKQPLEYVDGMTEVRRWESSLQNGSESTEIILPEAGLYKLTAVLGQSGEKNENSIRVYNSGNAELWGAFFNSRGTIEIQAFIPLRGQRINVTHSASGGGVDGATTFVLSKVVTN